MSARNKEAGGPPSLIRQLAYMGFKEDFDVPKQAMNIPRYSMLVCGMFCSIASSAVFAFSILSKKLSTDFHFTPADITTVSTVGMVIGYLTFPFGLIYDYVGPKPIFALGILLAVLGTLLFALVFDGVIPANVAGVSLINAILNLGCTLYDMGSVLTVLSWFPLDRGLVIACMKTATGLGSSIVSVIYDTYFTGNEKAYMYFLMAFCIGIGIISIGVIYLPPYHMTGQRVRLYDDDMLHRAADYESLYMRRKAPLKRFVYLLILLIALFILITTRTMVFVYRKDVTQAEREPPTIIMLILYVSLLFVMLPVNWFDVQPSFYDQHNEALSQAEEQHRLVAGEEPLVDTVDKDDEDRDAPSTSDDAAAAGLQLTSAKDVRRALRLATETEKVAPQFPTGFFTNARRPTLICMWVVGFCVCGVVLVVQMNSTEIFVAISEDYKDKQSPPLYVAITSIGSGLGRIIMAFCEVGTQSKPITERLPVTFFYIVPPILCFLSCVFFLIVPTAGLVVPMLLAGLGNGFYSACEVITARSIFSIDISQHYNSLFFFEMLSLIFMNRLLFGELMTKHTTRTEDGSPVCIGRKKCIQTTFIVLAAVSAVGVVAGICVHLTYRAFAREQLEKRAEHRAHLEAELKKYEEAEEESHPHHEAIQSK